MRHEPNEQEPNVRHLVLAGKSGPTAVLCFVCLMNVAQKNDQLLSFVTGYNDVMLECILPYDVIIVFFFTCLTYSCKEVFLLIFPAKLLQLSFPVFLNESKFR